MNNLSVTEKIDLIAGIANELKKHPQIDFPVTHRFAPGVYLREIFMPKGSIIVGKIHKTEHFNIILTGKVSVFTVEGVEVFEAPHTFVSKAGVQKVVLMHEDCQWQTVHVTDKTEIEDIEKDVIAENYDDDLISNLTERLLEKGK